MHHAYPGPSLPTEARPAPPRPRTDQARINDRGPDVQGRIIALSFEAAKELGAVSGGTIPIRIRMLSLPPP